MIKHYHWRSQALYISKILKRLIHKKTSVANIHWIVEKARDFQKNIYFCFIDFAKVFDFGHLMAEELTYWKRL